MRIGQVQVVDTGKRVFSQVQRDDVPGLAAELSYRFFLALFPFFIFLAALGGLMAGLFFVQDPTQQIIDQLSAMLPGQAAELIRPALENVVNSNSPGLLSFGILGALWAATGGMKAIMKAMNRAYDVEETRPFWKKNLMGVGLTLLAGIAIIAAFIVMVVGQVLGREIAGLVGMQGTFETVVSLARWPVAILLVLLAASFLYWAPPNMHLPFKWITPGAVLFTVGWLATTLLFALYVSNFGSYGATYGTLGGVVVLLLWFYLTSMILLVGAELNAVVDEQINPEHVERQRQEKQQEKQRKEQGDEHEPRERQQKAA